MKDELRADLQSNGASLVGYADLRGISPEARQDLPFAVSLAVALNPQVISGIVDGPTQEYWEEYERANALLDTLGRRTVAFLQTQGHQAKWLAPTIIATDPVTATSVSYDPKTLSAPLPHKTAATLAGLGWIGKCALLVTREFGSAVRLTTVLTDADLPAGKPVETSRCGSCTNCVDACPGHAPSGKIWTAGVSRESFFDAFACRKAALEQATERISVRNTICGICIASCRRTQHYLRKAGFPIRDRK